MKIEIKKTLINRTFYVLFGVIALLYLLGFFLPFGLDKEQHINYREFLVSTYTAFTQFSPMLFPFLIAFSINKDYSEKTGLFYRLMNIDSRKYFIRKIGVLFLEALVVVLGLNIVVSIIYSDFSGIIQMTILFSLVVLCNFLIPGILSLVFSNVILAIGISLVFWLFGVILVTVGGIFKFVAFFDQSNFFFKSVHNYLNSNDFILAGQIFWQPILYTGILVIICVSLSKLLNNRFFRQGVEG